MRRIVLILFALVLFFGCGVTSKTVVKPMPNWLQSRPNSSLYFIGIGGVKKNGTPDYYMKASRQDALSDMASSISTSISSVSVVSRVDNSSGYAESFSENVKSKAEEIFQDAELVEQFQTETDYYSYYRILKADYFRIKAERKQKAIELAFQKFNSGVELEKNDNFVQAINFYIHGLASLKDYLNQVSMVKLNSDSVDLANELFTRVTQLATNINITHIMRSISVKQGQNIESSDLNFIVKSTSGKLLSGLPVKYVYSGGFLEKDRDVSDVNGNVSTHLEKVFSNSDYETIKVSTDIESVIRNATTDMFIRGMFKHIQPRELTLRINVQKPLVWIEFVGNGISNEIKNMVIESVSQNQFNVIENSENADHVVSIQINKGCDKIDYGYNGELKISTKVYYFNDKSEIVFDKKYTQQASSENECNSFLDKKVNSVFKSIVVPVIIRKIKGL